MRKDHFPDLNGAVDEVLTNNFTDILLGLRLLIHADIECIVY